LTKKKRKTPGRESVGGQKKAVERLHRKSIKWPSEKRKVREKGSALLTRSMKERKSKRVSNKQKHHQSEGKGNRMKERGGGRRPIEIKNFREEKSHRKVTPEGRTGRERVSTAEEEFATTPSKGNEKNTSPGEGEGRKKRELQT